MDFAVPADHRVKKKGDEKRDKYVDLGRELKKNNNKKKTKEYKGDGNTTCCWHTRNSPQRFDKGIGRLRNQKPNRDQPDHKIIKIG